MATIGVQAKNNNPAPKVYNYPEHATHGSFAVGDLVKLDTNGKLQVAASDQALFGVAKKGYSGTEGTLIPVMVLDSNAEFVMQADTTTTIANEGVDYGLNIGTPGSMSVDVGDETTTSVVVQRLDERDGPKANGRVVVKFKPGVIQGYTG